MGTPLSPEYYDNQLRSYIEERTELDKSLQSGEALQDPQKYQKISRRYSEITEIIKVLEEITQLNIQYAENSELLESENNKIDGDSELIQLAISESSLIKQNLDLLEAKFSEMTVEKDPMDDGNAIVEIRAGAGGDEASLFAQELYRGYTKFAENLGFKVEIANISYGSVGGFKEIIFFINGTGAYKHFKYENGVHRVQRVPATESSGRIHTSTVSVVVLPESDDIKVEINESDLRIDVYRAGGPGGQSVNTTDSAVRIVHVPTGIIVTCQDEKSQHKNKAKAMKILQAKLFDIAKQEEEAKMSEIRKSAIKSGDRSAKIRTYNFPQSRVTDHRIKESWHNITEIMEGSFGDIVSSLAAAELAEAQEKK